MRRTECSACSGTDLQIFLDLGDSPIADAYTDKPDADVVRYPLELAVCAQCHLVQMLEVIPAKILFNADYSFFSSDSPPLVAYHQRYAADVLQRYADDATLGVLEIGCNDGDLLQHFRHLSHLGVDPTSGTIARARERGLDVREAAFGLDLARDLDQKFGLVLANHVLAHVEDVSDVVAGITHALRADGLAIIEVQYLPDLLLNNAFDLAYHEHRNFFSFTSLEAAFARHGLRIVDAQLTDRQGGSVRVVATPGRATASERVDRLRGSERWLTSFGAYEGMQGRAERIRDRLWDLLEQESGAGRLTVGYGAPAKATTLLNFCRLDPVLLSYVMDPAPGKVGRYIPGTDIQIVMPDATMHDPNATVLLLAWNYASAIMRQYEMFAVGGGRWIVPFPAPVLL